MRRLRILLSLLLCLTVPVAGWASLLSGPACPPSHAATAAHHHSAGTAAHHHHSASASVLAGEATSLHQHRHLRPSCGLLAAHHGSCKGDHCACGCGMGACTAPALSLSMASPVLLLSHARDAAVNFADVPPHAFARGSLPLRPPIS